MLKSAAPEIKEKFGVESLSLFGSVARGDNSSESDIDLYVSMPPKAYNFLCLKDYLQNLLGTTVDLIRHRTNLDPFLLQEIKKDGLTIF